MELAPRHPANAEFFRQKDQEFSDSRNFPNDAPTASVSAGLFFTLHWKQLVAESDSVCGGRDLPEAGLEDGIGRFRTCG